jgi:NADPH:quinone reductase-like Zn-dependent oxidoreductase
MATMNVVQYRAYSSDIENLEIVQVPKPVPQEGQVLVKIFVAAGNQIDLYLFYGIMRSNRWRMYFPFTPGYDFSGVIDQIGTGVTGFEEGDEVFGVHWGISRHDNPKDPNERIAGCFAEYLLVDASKLSMKPRRVPFGYAAALGTAGTAAYQCVHDIGLVGRGSKCLILGGSTMVGLMAIQLAKLAGAWVATTCSIRSHDFVSQFSPDLVIHYDTEKWYQHPQIQGLDFILDMAGVPNTLDKLKEVDHLINVGAAFVSLVNPDVGSNSKAHPPFSYARFYCFQQSTKIQDTLMQLLDEDKLHVPICDHFPFTRRGVINLFETLQGRQAQGKLLLRLD